MKFMRPKGALAGFYANGMATPLFEVGELWTPCDWKIRDHYNQGWELFYQAKGSSTWKIKRQEFHVPVGGYYLISPYERHELISFQGSETHFYFAVFSPQNVLGRQETFLLKNWPKNFTYGSDAQTLESPFRALIREITLEGQERQAGIALQIKALCLETYRVLSNPAKQLKDFTRHPIAVRAQECLNHNLGHHWKLDELAALCGISVPHLIELFKNEFKEPPKRYLTLRRLDRAVQLLKESDMPITSIALGLGFDSSQHFAHIFQKHFNSTPSSVRKMRPT